MRTHYNTSEYAADFCGGQRTAGSNVVDFAPLSFNRLAAKKALTGGPITAAAWVNAGGMAPDRLYPGLGHHLDEETTVAIDCAIRETAYFPTDSPRAAKSSSSPSSKEVRARTWSGSHRGAFCHAGSFPDSRQYTAAQANTHQRSRRSRDESAGCGNRGPPKSIGNCV